MSVVWLSEYDTRVRNQLIDRGFVEMQGDNIPICAWSKDGIRVDVMPGSGILGFSNSWYEGAIRSARTIQIEGIAIRVINPPYFLATKMEAFESRGKNDFLMSHDLEDILSVMDGRPEIVDEIERSDDVVRTYLTDSFRRLMAQADFVAAVPGHVVDAGRAPVVFERIQRLTAS